MLSLPDEVKQFMNVFKRKGYQIYLVGGAVRDLLLGKKTEKLSSNWDFTTNATPDEILKLFPKAYYNNQYGTVGVVEEKDIKKILNDTIVKLKKI